MSPSDTLLTADDLPFDTFCNSGASSCAFNSLIHFPHHVTPPHFPEQLGGIANSLPIHGIGTAVITLRTHSMSFLRLRIPNSLYVPDLPCNLISPQWLTSELQKQNKNSSFHIFPHGCLLIINTHIIPLKYHPTSNLPTFTLITMTHSNKPTGPSSPAQHLSSETTNFTGLLQSNPNSQSKPISGQCLSNSKT